MSAADAGNYITLRGLCEYISVSPATGRNWLKMGKITPQIEKNGAPLFTQEYVSRLKKDLLTGKSTLLKSRRNKKYVTGSSIYESYITAASANIPKVQQLMEMVCSQGIIFDEMELRALLAECALQLILQREGISAPAESKKSMAEQGKTIFLEELSVPAGVNVLSYYLKESFPLNGYEFLIDDLILDKKAVLSCLEKYPQWFTAEYRYEEAEDILGLLYISCKNIGKRKAAGTYYTPTFVVKKLITELFEANDAKGKKVLDPCCGTGNFLLQLPGEVTLENIYGGDIDHISVCIARINLALKFRSPRRELLYGHICVNDYLSVEMAVHFDYIIGNPPWGYQFTEDEKKRLRDKYACARGKNIESYDVFTEQAISNLKCGGIMSFVLPESILNVKAHMPIREFLMKRSSIQYLEYLGEVFDGVQCPSIILQVLYDSQPMRCAGMKVRDGEHSYTITGERRICREYFNFTATDEEYGILQKIGQVPRKVTLAGRAKFALGIVTGNNKKFITDEKLNGNEVILKGSDIQKFRFTEGKRFIAYRPELFQQTAPTEYYRAPRKLLYRFISDQLVFAYDDRQTLSLNSCNVVIPEIEGLEIKYVLAVLNSRVAQFYFEKSFQSVKVLRSHIEQIPIPAIDRAGQEGIIRLTDKLIAPAAADDIIKNYEILDAAIAQIFGLSQEEYQVVKESVGACSFL